MSAATSPLAAHLPVYELDGVFLRHVSHNLGSHVEGFVQAARRLRRLGLLSDTLIKKLVVLDTTYSTARHINNASCSTFFGAVVSDSRTRAHQRRPPDRQPSDVDSHWPQPDLQSHFVFKQEAQVFTPGLVTAVTVPDVNPVTETEVSSSRTDVSAQRHYSTNQQCRFGHHHY
ncbi:unnamed protein product, partial [Prorocentrum cordatum]